MSNTLIWVCSSVLILVSVINIFQAYSQKGHPYIYEIAIRQNNGLIDTVSIGYGHSREEAFQQAHTTLQDWNGLRVIGPEAVLTSTGHIKILKEQGK